MWKLDTPCNKLPDVIIKYWDGSYLKCCYGKPDVVGIQVGSDGKIDELMLTTPYRKYTQNESWCKTIEKWLAKDPSFLIYHVMSPSLLPNGHLYQSAELFNSHSSDIKSHHILCCLMLRHIVMWN